LADAVQPIIGATTATPTFIFLASGTYPITLTVLNASGAPDSITNSVSVTVPQPPGLPVITVVSNVDGVVELSATATNSPTSWSWSAPGGSPSTGSTSTFTTTYVTDGLKTIEVTATNGVGPGPTASEPVTVNLLTPPVVTNVDTTTINSGGTVTLVGTATNSPTSWTWTMAPGGTLESGGTTGTPTFTFTSGGSYPGTVTATNSDGTSSPPFDFTVIVVDPVASFTTIDDGGGDVNFINTSTPPPGPGVSYEWDFGDGSPLSSDVSPLHNYTMPGSYNVTLTVTVGLLSNSITVPINVS